VAVRHASHELRNPLAVLRGELELAARPGRDLAELTAAVRGAGAEAERLARLTDDLLLLARSDEDRFGLRLERTDIGALLRRGAELAGSRLAAAGVTGRVDVPPGTCADVDPDRILQAVDNLVGNALRFAPQGSVIVLAARAAGGDLEIEVSDDGPGFPVGFLPHAFERFARPDSGRSRDDGGGGIGPGHCPGHCRRARRGCSGREQAGRRRRGHAAPTGRCRPGLKMPGRKM
jgi:signal transduction histidine kinase